MDFLANWLGAMAGLALAMMTHLRIYRSGDAAQLHTATMIAVGCIAVGAFVGMTLGQEFDNPMLTLVGSSGFYCGLVWMAGANFVIPWLLVRWDVGTVVAWTLFVATIVTFWVKYSPGWALTFTLGLAYIGYVFGLFNASRNRNRRT